MDIISAKYLITMDAPPLMAGAIAVENGEIIDVGSEKDLLARYENALLEEHPHHVLMPGLVNAHTHLEMTLHKNYPYDPVRQMAVDVSFVDWLISCIDYKKQSGPERLRQAVQEGLDAVIESGTTCVGDMGSFEGLPVCLDEVGIRAVIFPEVLSYDSSVAQDLYETAMAMIEKYMDFDSDLIGVGAGPYSPYTLSRNILKIMAQYCRSSNLPLMMHTAESFSEVEFFYNSTGDIATRLFPNIGWGDTLPPAFHKTPVHYLEDIDFLRASPILVGCSQITPADVDRIAASGSKIAWCPRSARYLKEGVPPIAQLLAKNVVLGLGTDGISSVNTLSMWDEMRMALEILKNAQGGEAETVLKMATVGGAKVLGLSDQIGTLTPGKRADYILVDTAHHDDTSNLYAALIHHTKGFHVQKVVVDGKTIKNMN
ncbi:amidohydrolase family protein [bacterium]|nr:amidohydrolase family protein [bacterium]